MFCDSFAAVYGLDSYLLSVDVV